MNPQHSAVFGSRTTVLQGILATLAVVYTLAVARSLLIPVFLALMLSLVFAPVSRKLRRLHLPRAVSAALIVAFLVGAVGYGISILGEPASIWIDKAPQVLREIERDLRPIKKTVEDVNKTAEEVDRIASIEGGPTVRLQNLDIRSFLLVSTRDLLVGTVIMVFMLYFFLAWGRSLSLHISSVISGRQSQSRYLEVAHLLEHELSRYLFTVTLINIGLGAILAIALAIIGMPNPLLWGVIAALFNFIPYIGGLATMILLGAASFVSFEGLQYPILITLGFLVLTTLEGQVITPEILGRRMSLNPLVVILSIIFWFWIWGIIGAFMAVPILLAIRITGEYAESVRPLSEIIAR